MSKVNVRAKIMRHSAFNGVDAGGAMSADFEAGYDQILRSQADGLGGPPLEDLYLEYCRGQFVTQDWTHFIDLLNGSLGVYSCYERKAGAAPATGYIKHTITGPVVHACDLNISKDGYATTAAAFECEAADETTGFADMFTSEDAQAAPATYMAAARGGWRIKSAVFTPTVGTAITIYHNTAFRFAIRLTVDKESNDGDKGYTQVDLIEESGQYGGSLAFQDSAIATSLVTAQRLVAAGRGSLVLRVIQGAGDVDKIITIAGVRFTKMAKSSGPKTTGHTCSYDVTNDATTPLSLAGANKILTIADAA
ncbi:MAG: hypothetical protein LLF76_08155 [Planctomycetaceae bacterium]|nr:hypothetical protein [Planctomycetaceae bacterium]